MAIPQVESEIGLFTVVKKVIPETGRVMLRLVFDDQRAPNKFWRDPPWTPHAGPGAFAAIDLGQVQGEGEEAWLAMASGDLPDCFFHWGIEEELAAWFAVPEITVGDLEKTLNEEGDYVRGSHPPSPRGSRRSDEAARAPSPADGLELVALLGPKLGCRSS